MPCLFLCVSTVEYVFLLSLSLTFSSIFFKLFFMELPNADPFKFILYVNYIFLSLTTKRLKIYVNSF